MRFFKLSILIFLTTFFHSCATVKEGFTNQKKNSNDEFLVEKKSPLVMPPDYDQLPLPGEDSAKSGYDENKIKDLVLKKEEKSNKTGNINNSLEDSLLEKIKKN